LPLPSASPVGPVLAPRFLSCFTLPLFCKRSQKLNPMFSHSSALFKEEHSANFFGISGFRTLLQNTGGVPTPFFSFLPLLTTHNSLFTNSFRICSSAKHAHKPFRMRSFKTHDLKPFRMCSYKKKGGAPPHPSSEVPAPTPDRSVGARHVVPSFLFLARLQGRCCPLCGSPTPKRKPYLRESTSELTIRNARVTAR
jgi:hypothetical protein